MNWNMMKVTTFVCILLFLCRAAFSQTIAVGLDKMNIAYVGLANPITAVVENADCNSIKIEASNGYVKGTGCQYDYFPQGIGKGVLTVYEKKNGKWKECGVLQVRVKRLPTPEFHVSGKAGGYISKAKLLISNAPSIVLPNFDFDLKIPFRSYSVQIWSGTNSEMVFERKFTAPTLSFDEETKAQFQKLNHGDKLTFTNIKVDNPFGQSNDLANVDFTVVILH
jgi:hypothetical protein